MSSSDVRFALQLPKSVFAQIQAHPPSGVGISVSIDERPVGSEAKRDLKFDPVTGDPMVWVVVGIVGQTMIDFAVNVLASWTTTQIQAAESAGQANYEVEIRLKNGEIWRVSSRHPIDVAKLRRALGTGSNGDQECGVWRNHSGLPERNSRPR